MPTNHEYHVIEIEGGQKPRLVRVGDEAAIMKYIEKLEPRGDGIERLYFKGVAHQFKPHRPEPKIELVPVDLDG